MSNPKNKLFKAVKIILILAGIGAILYFAAIATSVALLFKATSDHTELYGEIKVYGDTHKANVPIALEFVAPDQLEGIHRLMWGATFEGDSDYDTENMYESDAILDAFSSQEIKNLFGKDITDFDDFAIYIPRKSGTVTIELAGFYKQTNPQIITEIEVTIDEK